MITKFNIYKSIGSRRIKLVNYRYHKNWHCNFPSITFQFSIKSIICGENLGACIMMLLLLYPQKCLKARALSSWVERMYKQWHFACLARSSIAPLTCYNPRAPSTPLFGISESLQRVLRAEIPASTRWSVHDQYMFRISQWLMHLMNPEPQTHPRTLNYTMRIPVDVTKKNK